MIQIGLNGGAPRNIKIMEENHNNKCIYVRNLTRFETVAFEPPARRLLRVVFFQHTQFYGELCCEFHGEFTIIIIAHGNSRTGEGNGSVFYGLVSGSRSLLGVG